jgi:hypothetical protein
MRLAENELRIDETQRDGEPSQVTKKINLLEATF